MFCRTYTEDLLVVQLLSLEFFTNITFLRNVKEVLLAP